jgi:CHAD domain-containing protein
MSAAVPTSKQLKTHVESFVRALRHIDDGDVRALHRTRVASRRLREIIPVLPVRGDRARKLSRRLRRITSRLGAVRELDVLLLLLDELHGSRRAHSDALARVAVSVATDRDRARRGGRVSLEPLRRTARKLRELVDDLKREPAPDVRGTRWAVEARIVRRATRLADALSDAGAVYLPERLHAVRIAVKKLRYSVELANSSGVRSLSATSRLLRRAQDILGRMHDRQVLIDRVRHVQATLTPPSISVWRSLDALVASLDDDCRRLHGRYMRLRPELAAAAKDLAPTPELRTRRSDAGTRTG